MWKHIKKVLHIIKENTSRLLGNGHEINIWEESIMGKPLLSTHLYVQRLRRWMSSKGLISLDAISQWNQHDNTWKDWKTPNFP